MTVHDETTRSTRTSLRSKLTIGAVAVTAAGALAFGGIALTNAFFTSTATIGDQTLSTDTVEISAEFNEGSMPFAFNSILPGDSFIAEVNVVNTGTEDLYFGVGPFPLKGDSSDPLAEAFELQVLMDDGDGAPGDGGPTLTRTLAEWGEGTWEGFTIEGGQTRVVTIIATLPATAGNELQDTAVYFDLSFIAQQVQNNTAYPATPTWVPAD